MRVFDEHDNLLETYDSTKGNLVRDRRLVCHHASTEEVKEEGHWETVAEYPNGGKDVAWVVDVPGVEATEEWDEYEDIFRFIPFTEKECAVIRIIELKQKLSDTDYNILKVMEGAATLSEMASVIEKRAQWLKEINELEEITNSISKEE